MSLEPADSTADRFGIGWHTGLTQDVDDESGPISIAGSIFRVGCAVAAIERPTTSGSSRHPGCFRQQVGDRPFAIGGIHQPIDTH